jgi:hypothetical protein
MEVIRELTPCGTFWTASIHINMTFVINILLKHLNLIQ